ncbi:MAG: energy transducer TonB [Candidatus Rokuibacteriota bacterium]
MTGTMRAALAALASTGVHLALAGGLVALSRAGGLPSIFVDLSEPAHEAPAPSAPARVAPPVAARSVPRAARAPAPPAAAPAPAPVPAAPAAPPPVPAEPRPEPAPTAIEAPAAAPSAPAPAVALPVFPGPAQESVGTSATPGPRAGTGSDTRGEGGPSTASGPATAVARPGESRAGVPPEYAGYLARFRQGVRAALTYPMAARRRGLAGVVELEVSIDTQGRVRDVRVSASSSHAILDEAAADAVRRLPPMPFPPSLPARALTVRLPLVFALQ